MAKSTEKDAREKALNDALSRIQKQLGLSES